MTTRSAASAPGLSSLRAVARRAIPAAWRRSLWKWFLGLRGGHVLEVQATSEASLAGARQAWKDRRLPERQLRAFAPVMAAFRRGELREDFVALDRAMALVDAAHPVVIEIGCGSGWNGEVLAATRPRGLTYVGVDYSAHMVRLARTQYPERAFAAGDAAALPLRTGCCDVLLSGTVLMHVVDYRSALRESRRVSRRWCILHTVPLAESRPTQALLKKGYGVEMPEIVFNRGQLHDLIREAGMSVTAVFPSLRVAYLDAVVGEPVRTWTLVCEVVAGGGTGG